jgi:hypothetical protein
MAPFGRAAFRHAGGPSFFSAAVPRAPSLPRESLLGIARPSVKRCSPGSRHGSAWTVTELKIIRAILTIDNGRLALDKSFAQGAHSCKRVQKGQVQILRGSPVRTSRAIATLLSHAGRRAKLTDWPSITPIVAGWVMQIQISAGVALMATAGDAARLNERRRLRPSLETREIRSQAVPRQAVSQSVSQTVGQGGLRPAGEREIEKNGERGRKGDGRGRVSGERLAGIHGQYITWQG